MYVRLCGVCVWCVCLYMCVVWEWSADAFQQPTSYMPKESYKNFSLLFANNWRMFLLPTTDLADLLAINAVQDVSIHSRQLTSKLHTGSRHVRAGSSKNGQVNKRCGGECEGGVKVQCGGSVR